MIWVLPVLVILIYADVPRAPQPLRVRSLHLRNLNGIFYTHENIIVFVNKVTRMRQHGVYGAGRLGFLILCTPVVFRFSFFLPSVWMSKKVNLVGVLFTVSYNTHRFVSCLYISLVIVQLTSWCKHATTEITLPGRVMIVAKSNRRHEFIIVAECTCLYLNIAIMH